MGALIFKADLVEKKVLEDKKGVGKPSTPMMAGRAVQEEAMANSGTGAETCLESEKIGKPVTLERRRQQGASYTTPFRAHGGHPRRKGVHEPCWKRVKSNMIDTPVALAVATS